MLPLSYGIPAAVPDRQRAADRRELRRVAGLVHGQERDVTNRTYPPGVPCWVHTEQPDVEAATAFYGGIFGWTNEDAMPPGAPGRYVIAKLDGQDVGAIAGPRQGAAVWSTYVSVDDADAAAQRLVSAGATVRSAPATRGRAAAARC